MLATGMLLMLANMSIEPIITVYVAQLVADLSRPRFFWTPICPTGGGDGEVQHEQNHKQ
jgi:hypothetical protein